MNIYIVDAFTTHLFSGNQAGVVLVEPDGSFPEERFMRGMAAELKHSETAFVKQLNADSFHIRYFTPLEEVDLCGHATISVFSVLRDETIISPGHYKAFTLAGELNIHVQKHCVWMDMAEPRELRSFSEEESLALYQAYGLDLSHQPAGMEPKVISTGISDILLPVNSRSALAGALQSTDAVTRLSKAYEAVGFHLFYVNAGQETTTVKCQSVNDAGSSVLLQQVSKNATAFCRNFAPLYGIDEEPATGTANGALTYYLYQYGLIKPNDQNCFIQGEIMGRPSVISTRLSIREGQVLIHVGGNAVISLKGKLWKNK